MAGKSLDKLSNGGQEIDCAVGTVCTLLSSSQQSEAGDPVGHLAFAVAWQGARAT
jgi:hypothetical protein